MSPSSSCFSLVISSTTLPFRTVALVHLGSSRVEDTTYLGRLFSRTAHSPGRDAHRAPSRSSLRRPSSRAAGRGASPYSTLPHSSRSLPPDSPNQPPSLKPSSPSGSWTTPSSETFVLITIFPISVLPLLWCQLPPDAGAAAPGKWPPAGRPVRPSAGACTGWKCGKVREEGDPRVGEVAADLVSRAQAGDGDAFRKLTEPYLRELQVHSYRILRSFQHAQPAPQ